jgi:sterol 3beta-glucosyltransferase
MKITILAYGTRGDVQPYLALGVALARAGHRVRLAAPQMFAGMAADYIRALPDYGAGWLEFQALAGDPTNLMRAASSTNPLMAPLPASVRMGLTVVGYVAPVVRQLFQQTRTACADADLVVHSLLTTVLGHQIARERGLPDVSALIFPVFMPTGQFPNPLFSPWPAWMRVFGRRAAGFGRRYHYLTHREFNRAFWHGNRLAISLLRRRDPDIAPLEEWPFDFPGPELPAPARPTPVIYGISRHALPCTADRSMGQRMTGYWFLDAPPGWQPPADLVRFLGDGPPPVFIGFGSVISREAARLAHAAIEALRLTGQRGVLLRGWGGLDPSSLREALPRQVYLLDHAPFDWLFPRVAAAVHHGGMGTTASALRAGIPQMAAPFTFDQPFWGRQVHALGVGPAPASHEQLTARGLAEGIEQMLGDGSLRCSARALGEKIRAEDGLGNAVAMIERAVQEESADPQTTR